jgi:hypothetical protein
MVILKPWDGGGLTEKGYRNHPAMKGLRRKWDKEP